MSLVHGMLAVARAAGDGIIDWDAAASAAKAALDPGGLELDADERRGYAADVRDARDAVRAVVRADFDLPRTIEVQHRHHWIDANVDTFARVMAPLEAQPVSFPGVARVLNTGTMAAFLGFVGGNVLGQYDPLLLADGDDDHGLYFVRPNILQVAEALAVDEDRFRRWIAFHEVTHAAEFSLAPWLPGHLEDRMAAGVGALARGSWDRTAFRELDAAMTAVEGYAELLMDLAFDDDATDLREKIEARRRGRDPLTALLARLLGFGVKRRQYERGAAFFEAVEAARGLPSTTAVWDEPGSLPRPDELDDPAAWLRRVDP